MTRSRASGALAWACVLAAVYVAADSLQMAYQARLLAPDPPTWDFLRRCLEWRTGLHSAWSLLWAQHLEHRFPLNFLILGADLALFGLKGIFPVVCAWLFQLFTALLWIRVYADGEIRPSARIAFGALMFACVFSAAQWENLILPFEATFTAVFFLASAAIFAMLRHCRNADRPSRWAFFAWCSAAAAGGFLAGGLLLWPLLALIAFAEKAPRKTVAATLFVGAAFCGAYLIGYVKAPTHADPTDSFRFPAHVAAYMGAYCFSPLRFFSWRPGFLAAAGLAACAAGAGLPAYYFGTRRSSDPRAFFAYAFMFCGGVGFLTALGRLNFPLTQATAARYRTPVLLLWAAGLAVVALKRAAASARTGTLLPLAVAAMIVVVIIPNQASGAAAALRWSQSANRSAVAIALDIPDRQAWAGVLLGEQWARFFDGNLSAAAIAARLRRRRLSLFGDRWIGAMGSPVGSLLQIGPPSACSGSAVFEPLAPPVRPGSGRVYGRAWEIAAGRPLAVVVLADEQGRLAGLGYGERPRARFFSSDGGRPPDFWSGYAAPAASNRTLTAYGVLGDGRTACLLARLVQDAGTSGNFVTLPAKSG